MRFGRQGAGFSKAATEAEHGVWHAGIFVKPCGNGDGIWKRAAPQLRLEARIVAASVATWNKDATNLSTPEGREALTAALRDMVRDYSLTGVAVRLVLSGEFCLVRAVRGTLEEVRSELAQLEQRSRLYLSLGPGEKVMVSRTRALDARHAHALGAVCNRSTLDAVQAAAEATGIEVSTIEPSLVALSRAVSRLPDAPADPFLVVQLNGRAMEVGVCHQGKLLLDYRPGGKTRVVDLPTLLEKHLSRLNRHVNRFINGNAATMERVYLCGDAEAVREAAAQFKKGSKLDVQLVRAEEIQATWSLPENAAAKLTAPILGGILANYLPEGELEVPNLMQHILERKRVPLRPILLRSSIPLAASILIMFGMMLVNRQQQGALDAMQAEYDALAPAQARASELRLQLGSSTAKLAQLEKLAAQLPCELGGPEVRNVGGCLPTEVWLTSLEVTDCKSARLTGASYAEPNIYNFVQYLQDVPNFGEVALKSTNPGSSESGPITNFELELKLGADAKPIAPPKVARHE